MFGYRMIFRSRWGALLWAIGILFTAWRMTPRAEDTPSDAPSEHAHVNPWAKDPPKEG
ncbi:hypothetical protein [Novosphingobium huizhouense]|uniref:hypothetical protein n=1 Tax=Novosphingobium huizhouense TaxID=2866625 RepID=UPI001CD87790|nr:hypothetical protein [Novosphingobium huizhouense]